ncbi:MAG: restriction endonuclease subunit S, partial [Lachnospiraceae bacterium]|nr:restriction endonuclease subunit S [Lachnospiraceae bacterium]
MEMMLLEDCCDILDSMRVPITAKDRKKGPYPYYGANGIQDYVADYIFDDELVLLAEDGGNFGSEERPIAYKVSGKCWVNNHAHVLKPKKGIDVDYLCYSLMFYRVDGMVNGATRMKLTQAAMRKMLIPSRNIEEQKGIVRILNKVQMLIKEEKEQIERYDNLIKSRFVEMFGDININNKGWDVQALGELCTIIRGGSPRPIEQYLGGDIPWIKIGDATDSENIYLNSTKEHIIREGVKKSRM